MNKTLEKAKIKVADTLKHAELEQFTIDYIMNVVDIAYDIGIKSQPALKSGNSAQPVTVPEDRLQKAIVDSCMVFLHGCDSLSKNYECDFSDSETEIYFCIANVAKKIGVVEETGNRRWSLSKQMRDEINGVYRKYAMRIMEAAPKVTP